jgi:hypothetical protein
MSFWYLENLRLQFISLEGVSEHEFSSSLLMRCKIETKKYPGSDLCGWGYDEMEYFDRMN